MPLRQSEMWLRIAGSGPLVIFNCSAEDLRDYEWSLHLRKLPLLFYFKHSLACSRFASLGLVGLPPSPVRKIDPERGHVVIASISVVAATCTAH